MSDYHELTVYRTPDFLPDEESIVSSFFFFFRVLSLLEPFPRSPPDLRRSFPPKRPAGFLAAQRHVGDFPLSFLILLAHHFFVLRKPPATRVLYSFRLLPLPHLIRPAGLAFPPVPPVLPCLYPRAWRSSPFLCLNSHGLGGLDVPMEKDPTMV